ncbi:hypothetical protein M2D07_023275 [Pseudomonas sp. BGr12]|uniref:hypothetical protein n=1 Tax=unclassified Pseudomonas TaxID=196821 RepID=UPI00177FFA7A|nr:MULTISPECIES: hypothetical protein [unclassified Pseudomonas]MBD9504191.1 hypothetical protein [Pseudomonas sp. PDM17]MDL2429960.1 hypothetical protein [Pseudomonas sp. BJa5]
MKNLKTFLTAVAFSFAGVAVHANAAAEASCSHSAVCFQLTPLADKSAAPQLAEDGFSRTPLGMRVNPEVPAQQTLAEDGFSRTPLGMRVNSEVPAQQTLAADGFGRTPLGKRVASSQDSGIA